MCEVVSIELDCWEGIGLTPVNLLQLCILKLVSNEKLMIQQSLFPHSYCRFSLDATARESIHVTRDPFPKKSRPREGGEEVSNGR